jgi:rRNA maturation RNase YbeY
LSIELYNQSSVDIPVDIVLLRRIAKLLEEHELCCFMLLEVVYVDEEEIVRINSEYLGRDYVTDVITFRYDEQENDEQIEGTMFCCAPRITEQAREYNQEPAAEYTRILIHGMLHLTGYEDKSESEKKAMTNREDYYLRLLYGY